MTISVDAITAGGALDALAGVVRDAKAGRPLAPVTVIVPTNTAGVMARRALGRLSGVAAVDMLTLYRLAELVGSPALVASGRSPVSTSVVDLAIRRVLADEPGTFETVAEHPSTVVALRDLHRELRMAGPDAVAALATSSPRGREAARISQLTSRRLRSKWYDEGDLLEHAESATSHGVPRQLATTIVYLPQQLRGRELRLLRGLAGVADVRVLLGVTGDPGADAELITMATALDATWELPAPADRVVPPPAGVDVVSTTDADDEVRIAVRTVLDAARAGLPFSRIAMLWAAERPYARLVEHHLDVAGIEWNGRPGTLLVERLVPRLVLDLLDVDRRGLRRRDLFDLLADVPARGADGERLHTAAWERVSRAAGVARDDHWAPRLSAYAARERRRAETLDIEPPVRNAADAEALAAFVTDLRVTLGPPATTRAWHEWAAWCTAQIDRWIGRRALQQLDDPEHAAWEQVERVLDRLRHLDVIGPPVSRREFRATFLAELEVAPPRQGRIGAGLTTGALAGAAGLDVDLAVVVGAADGMLPPPPRSDPLVSDADRAAAGLTTSDLAAARVHRQFLSTLSIAERVVITYPRGDLRATATRVPTRWVEADVPFAPCRDVASHSAGLLATVFPVSGREHRLRGLATHVAGGGELGTAGLAAGDVVLRRAIALRAARRSDALTVYDGDLTAVEVPRLDRPVSPTELETWMTCPHMYFVRYLLRVHEVEEPGDEINITPLDRGSALHTTLDHFNQAILAGALPQPENGWTAQHIAALAEIFDGVGSDTERAGRTGRPAYWAGERDRMRTDLLEWIQRDGQSVRERGARVIRSERRFGEAGDVTITLPGGRQLAVRGSIDRVDVTTDGSYVVTDYKTGRVSRLYAAISEADPTASGSRLQLPSYAAAALALAAEPGSTVRAEYSFFGTGNYRRVGYTFTPEIWAEVGRWLGHVVDGIESGLYPATPERPTWRSYTPCVYCDPDDLGTAERWGEWDRKRHDPRLERWFAEHDDDTSDQSSGAGADG